MYSPGPVGYQIHIKKRRPGLIVFLTLFCISLGALILYYSGFVPETILSGLNQSKKNVNDNVLVIAKNHKASVLVSRNDNKQMSKPVISVSLEFQSKDIAVIKTLGYDNNPLNHSESNVTPSMIVNDRNMDEVKSETLFSEPEYFNFGIGSSGSMTTNDVIKETNNDTLKKSKSIFYLIVSSVDTKELAEKQTQKFKKLSGNAGYVYVSSLDKYRIYIGCFSSLKEANSNLKSFQTNYPSYKPWIWKN